MSLPLFNLNFFSNFITFTSIILVALLAATDFLLDCVFSFISRGLTKECSDIASFAAGGFRGAAPVNAQYFSHMNR